MATCQLDGSFLVSCFPALVVKVSWSMIRLNVDTYQLYSVSLSQCFELLCFDPFRVRWCFASFEIVDSTLDLNHGELQNVGHLLTCLKRTRCSGGQSDFVFALVLWVNVSFRSSSIGAFSGSCWVLTLSRVVICFCDVGGIKFTVVLSEGVCIASSRCFNFTVFCFSCGRSTPSFSWS